KMENNKSIDRSIQQKTLYNALVDAFEIDKDLLETYRDTVTFKRRQDDEDEDEEPSARSNWGSKKRRPGKEPKSTCAPKEKTSKSTDKSKEGSKSHHISTGKSVQVEEPIYTDKDLEEPTHQEFDTGFTEDQPIDATTQHPDCTLAQNEDPRESFNELMDTPLYFSAFVLNWLKVDTLTLELLAGLTFELIKVIPFDHFINNDLAYLSGGVSSRTYATSLTKIKAADYEHIKWIEDFVPNSMWSQVSSVYDKHALWGISNWGRKRQQFYGFAVNRESARDVYSRHIIITVTKLQVVEWHNYKHLDWITVHRNDDKLYTFKEG
ncbi:hypothetical protein Tco_0030473, partial [Tanacetum coccineum]